MELSYTEICKAHQEANDTLKMLYRKVLPYRPSYQPSYDDVHAMRAYADELEAYQEGIRDYNEQVMALQTTLNELAKAAIDSVVNTSGHSMNEKQRKFIMETFRADDDDTLLDHCERLADWFFHHLQFAKLLDNQ